MTELELSRRDRKKDEMRRRLVKVAVELFREHGFELTTVDAISEKADVAKGTFFNYFPRKEAVLAYLSEARLIEAEARADVILASESGTREKIVELLDGVAGAYEKDGPLARYVTLELLRRSFSPFEETHARWHRLLSRFIEQGQWTGDVRRDHDRERAAGLLQTVFYATVLDWASSPDGRFALKTEVKARLALVFGGLSA